MIRAALLLSVLAATPALADGGLTVPLPQLPPLSGGSAEHLLMQLVVANVVSQNCPEWLATAGEWALLTGTADLVAESLGLGTDDYDDRFYRPAFALLDKPGTCGREGPRVRPLVNRLIAWGGTPVPLP